MASQDSPDDPQRRYLIGIDLGTTNSALAWIDTQQTQWIVHDFPIPQLVAPGEIDARDTLPSFHYQPATKQFGQGALRLPWTSNDPEAVAGILARDRGADVPGRLISSAKSWLSHAGVDRTAALLPWHAAPGVNKLSPAQASAAYLSHLRDAWNFSHPDHPMQQQDVLLTVPASFDEVARELTLQAARLADLQRVVLVEEPAAAFYAWIDAQHRAAESHNAGQPNNAAAPPPKSKSKSPKKRGKTAPIPPVRWDAQVKPGDKILVCDIGGGTSDFTLIRVRPTPGGSVIFHRVAVGHHLILGGDNLDLAMAHHLEQKLPGGKIDPNRWPALIAAARQAKETLLGEHPPTDFNVNIAAGGSKLIGGAMQLKLSSEEVEQIWLDGFLPRVPLSARPAARRSGFVEFGLPYAADSGITRYLAAFLSDHRNAGSDDAENLIDHDPARPDLLLFNGGFFNSPALRDRLTQIIASWFTPAEVPAQNDAARDTATHNAPSLSHLHTFTPSHSPPWTPTVLQNDRLDLAVARGAAYYGMVRRGRGVRISGGLAHSYYLAIDTSDSRQTMAICLMPAGVEEGRDIELTERRFELLIRQPAQFALYSSSVRTSDKPGQIVAIDPEQLSFLAPIRTVLQSGRSAEADTVSVHLHARLTEVGTLEIWCAEITGQRKWKLQFDVRDATQKSIAAESPSEAPTSDSTADIIEEAIVDQCRAAISSAFAKSATPTSIVKSLEQILAIPRLQWPPTLMRSIWESLMPLENSRAFSAEHESRWLNLAGFCLRPGYGLPIDDWRVGQAWRLFAGGVRFAKNEQCRAEWWILWRRIAGGLSAGQQNTLAEPLLADWRGYFRKAGSASRGRGPDFQFGPHESAETWRLLGSLELLKPPIKIELGDSLSQRLSTWTKASPLRDAQLIALGRIGARQCVYGPIDSLVPSATAEQWIQTLLQSEPAAARNTDERADDRAALAAALLARRTGDRFRDISDAIRVKTIDWLRARGAATSLIELVEIGGHLGEQQQRAVFGENLPIGLRIE